VIILNRKYFLVFLFIFIISLESIALNVTGQQSKPLYVAIVWHYHQPWYYDVNGTAFILPWTRMHTVGNYYKMAYILSKYPQVKATFTFSGSLIQQILDYNHGVKDYRQIISEKIANGQSLTLEEKFSMLVMPGGFFDVNWDRVVNVVKRYSQLRDKAQAALSKYIYLPEQEYKLKVTEEFTEQDYIDLAVLFNLFWIDPLVLREQYPDIYTLRQQALNGGSGFTRQQLSAVLKVHKELLQRVLGFYADLAHKGQVELIPVPYSHPLAPILADFGLNEDIKLHAALSNSLFQQVFNYKPQGVWPAEQAVNDVVLSIFANEGYSWTITDDALLVKAGFNPTDPSVGLKAWYATYNGRRIYVFFRNHQLSDLIGFQYSRQDSIQAAQDLVNRLLDLAKSSDGTNLVVIALDGENPWESYPEFGDVFLQTLYSLLSDYQSKGVLITTTPGEYTSKQASSARALPFKDYPYLDLAGKDISDVPLSYTDDAYTQLPRKIVNAQIPEGSWSGGELAVWIGQRQENVAWMMLIKTREDVLRKLGARSLQEARSVNPKAVEDILRAEASDWTFWYGGDMGGGFPANPFYKGYLRKAYLDAGLQPPDYLLTLFNPDATPVGVLNSEYPKPLSDKLKLDGELTEKEWSKALNMSMGNKIIRNVLVLPAYSGMYIAAVPVSESVLSIPEVTVALYFTTPSRSVSPYHPGYNSFPRYANVDLGMGLFFEVLMVPRNSTVIVSAADGRGSWIPMYYFNLAVKNVMEAYVPWNALGLEPGQQVYLTAVSYKGSNVAETASRVGSVYQLIVPRATLVSGAKVLFEANDPEGDDDGAGGYKYPKADVFKPGVFDMIKFRVVDSGETLLFEVYFKDLGGNPWGGPNGFCLQYPQIYIHTTLQTPGRKDTFGLNVNLTDDSAWHLALLLAPGWGSDPVPNGEKAALYLSDGTVLVQGDVFKVYADPARNAIIAEVSKKFLPDVEHADKWIYTVAVTSYDGYGSMKVRAFGIDPAEWVVGVGSKHAKAVLFNVVPRVMDLLAPTAQDQYSQLNSYVAEKNGTLAKIHGVSSFSTQPAQQQCSCPQPPQQQCPTCPTCPVPQPIQPCNCPDPTRSLFVGIIAGILVGVAAALFLKTGKREPSTS